ncbi:MAG: FIST N-terminal domain-containing protein [Actinomycetota bacterium]
MTARYASALSTHPLPAHAVGEVAGQVLDALGGDDPDLLVCFVSPHLVGALDDALHALHALLGPRVLLGATASGVLAGTQEVEDGLGVAVFAATLPGADLVPMALRTEDTPAGPSVVGWPERPDEGLDADVLLLAADPFTFPTESFLRRLDRDRPGLPVLGGLASASSRPGGNRLVVDGRIESAGAAAVLVGGAGVRTVVSQGCRPVGEPLVVTRGERNFVAELAGRPALERLRELAERADDAERALLQRGLQLGFVVDEHRAEFGRGDFLVRSVIGADRETGAIAVGEPVEVGRPVQFHVRDAAAADDDLRALLAAETAGAALCFTCNGRGKALFGVPDHDAGVVAETLGPVPVAGMFCAGEIGPVGRRNALHAFTASLALFP